MISDAGPAGNEAPLTTKKSLRIAIVGTAYPMRGGLAQYNALLAQELSRDHQVDLYSFTRQYPSLVFPGKSQMDESGESSFRYPATASVDSIGPWSWFRTANLIAKDQPDGLIFKFWLPFFAPAFGTIARQVRKKSPRTKVVAILDNLIPHERRPFDLPLARYFANSVDSFIAMSRSVEADLKEMKPEAPCRFVPHPVYPQFGERMDKTEARKQLGMDPDGRVLLFFGFVRDYKGLDVLIEAMPAVHEKTGAKLLVLGEFYSGKDRTIAQVKDLGVEDSVILHDEYVPDEKVGLYFSAADVVVLPYRSATQSGIVPIAYQLERPVICTDVGGLAEIVPHERTGLVIPPENSSALRDAIVRFYEENFEEPMAAAARIEKEQYSWAHMANAMESAITETLPGQSA